MHILEIIVNADPSLTLVCTWKDEGCQKSWYSLSFQKGENSTFDTAEKINVIEEMCDTNWVGKFQAYELSCEERSNFVPVSLSPHAREIPNVMNAC